VVPPGFLVLPSLLSLTSVSLRPGSGTGPLAAPAGRRRHTGAAPSARIPTVGDTPG